MRNKVAYCNAVPHNARPVVEIVRCAVIAALANAPCGSIESAARVVRAPVPDFAWADVDGLENSLQRDD